MPTKTICTECRYCIRGSLVKMSAFTHVCLAAPPPDDFVTGKPAYRKCSDVNDGNCRWFAQKPAGAAEPLHRRIWNKLTGK